MKGAIVKNPRYSTADGVPLSLSNLYYGSRCSTEVIEDVVEDASTAEELMDGLNALDIFEKFVIDRITDSYVRLKSEDGFGNTHYFKAEVDKNEQCNKLCEYYNPRIDGYQIPTDEMTPRLMGEITSLMKKHPFNKGGYLLTYCPSDAEGEDSFWHVVTRVYWA